MVRSSKKIGPSKQRYRSVESFKRPQNTRQERECILIVCEGKETEPNYFKTLKAKLKLKIVRVEIVSSENTTPIQIVEFALEKRDERQRTYQKNHRINLITDPLYDEIWCVFDVEQQGTNPSLDSAILKANSEKIYLAISNPVFEYWFLLHFAEYNRAFSDYKDVERELKKHIPKYQKNMNVCDIIFDNTTDAINRANNVLKNQPDRDSDFPNPSTSVSLLVEKLYCMVIP